MPPVVSVCNNFFAAECTEMRHFGIKIQKKFWGGGTPPPRRLQRLDLAPPRSPTLDPPLLESKTIGELPMQKTRIFDVNHSFRKFH